MTLDPRPSDAELLRRAAEKTKSKAVLVTDSELSAFARGVYSDPLRVRIDPRVPVGQVVTMHGETVTGSVRNLDRASQPAWWDARMNFTEQQYAQELEFRLRAGALAHWKYEPFSMRLAPNTYYRPDFLVTPTLNPHLTMWPRLEIHEVKGYWRDDARAKFKIAAELYPMFVFRAVRRVDGVFQIIETLNA